MQCLAVYSLHKLHPRKNEPYYSCVGNVIPEKRGSLAAGSEDAGATEAEQLAV